MKLSKIILIIILLAAAGALYYLLYVPGAVSPEYGAYETKTNAEGSVEVSVTPIFTENGLSFDVKMDTHTVQLSRDISAVLFDDIGRFYEVNEWMIPEGPVSHHLEGSLKFASLKARVKFVTLILKDIGGITERKFEWTI